MVVLKKSATWSLRYQRSEQKDQMGLLLVLAILINKEMQSIMNSSLNWKEVYFEKCKFTFEEINITSEFTSKINRLSFSECGLKDFTNWAEYPHLFENLIKSISWSSIKDSLIEIDLSDSGFSKEKNESVLELFGLNKVADIG